VCCLTQRTIIGAIRLMCANVATTQIRFVCRAMDRSRNARVDQKQSHAHAISAAAALMSRLIARANAMAVRADYLPRDALFALHTGCSEIKKSFQTVGVYLVGSAIDRPDYRDVDVRAIMRDEDFDATFSGHGPRFALTCMALSAWLKNLTGLPIDFQFQRMSIANERHKGERHSLGYFVWAGDAVPTDQQ